MALGDDQGAQSFVHKEIKNLPYLSRICFEATPRKKNMFLAMTRFVTSIMKNGMPVNDITM